VRFVVDYAVVERIMEKHSSDGLQLCNKRLNISAMRPRPDGLPVLSSKIDPQRLLFNNLPDSVDTPSFENYLRLASSLLGGGSGPSRQSPITDVIYGVHRGLAMVVFRRPYGRRIVTLLQDSKTSLLCPNC